MKDQAFGVIPVLPQADVYQFLLIQHHAGHWGFPKGHAETGESAEQAACREFTEETGIRDYQLVGGVSFQERYFFTQQGQTIEKTVVYFPAWVHSTVVECQAAEIKNYAWVTAEQAKNLITFNGGKQVLAEAVNYLATVKQSD